MNILRGAYLGFLLAINLTSAVYSFQGGKVFLGWFAITLMVFISFVLYKMYNDERN